MSADTTKPTVKFDPQTYLLSYLEDISKLVQAQQYNYVYCLDTNPDNSFPTTLAALTNRINAKKFTELKTHQYNSLLPKIRLYRVEYNSDKTIKSEKEFLFDKDTKYSASNMTQPIIRNNCGIKSINWRLAGSNPVTAEKQIEVELQFYFDSINSFSGGNFDTMKQAWVNASTRGYETDEFKNFDSDTTTKNYWSLILHPNNLKDNSKYDLFDFRIKAFVGWEDVTAHSPNIASDIFKDQETIDTINDLNYCFFLNLIKHQFNLNEDGSLTLTANYIAEFESTTLNHSFNILSNLKEELENFKDKKIRNLILDEREGILQGSEVLNEINNIFTIASNIKIDRLGYFSQSDISDDISEAILETTINQLSAQQKLFILAKDKDKRQNLINCLKTSNNQSLLLEILQKANEQNIETISEDLNKISDYANERIRLATTAIKNKFYSKFIKKLTDISDKNKAKYYAIQVNKDQITQWCNWVDNVYGAPRPKFNVTNIGTNLDQSSLDTELQNLTYIDKIDNIDAKLSNAVQGVLKSYDSGTTQKIVFTTFGHIIDTAYSIVEEELNNNQREDLVNELKRQKVILGNISDEYPVLNIGSDSAQSVLVANLAFIPIEINLLQAFLIENIVKAQKESYPLYSFIKDAIATLVIACLNISNIYNNSINKYANSSLATTIVSLGNNSIDKDPMINFTNIDAQQIDSSIINSSYLTKAALQSYYINSTNKHTSHYNYFIIYDKKNSDYKPLNDPDKDAALGVFHYTYGQNYGLIKSINFSRMDMPYLKEAKSVGRKTLFLGQFRDIYNADITMIGNNIYYPGMLLYIRPSVEVGIEPSESNPSFSQITGIGGYYFVLKVESSITEDGYETKLQTYWDSDGFIKDTSLSEEQKCNALLQEAGLQSENADSSNKLYSILGNLSLGIVPTQQLSGSAEQQNPNR